MVAVFDLQNDKIQLMYTEQKNENPMGFTVRNLWRSPLFWLSVVVALFYNSWPLGYVLDPSVEMHALASQLEAPHHPYSWLFVALDVITGLALVAVGLWQWRALPKRRSSRAIIVSYSLFGVLVSVAALTPLVCDPTAQTCGPLLHNYRLLIHGLASIASVLFLFAALLGVTINAYREHGWGWLSIGLTALLMGWLVFGVGSVAAMLLHLPADNKLQDFFISLCSLSIVAVVTVAEYAALRQAFLKSSLEQ